MILDLSLGIDIEDLAHAMLPDMPNPPSSPPYALLPNVRLGDTEDESGYSGCNEAVTMSSHAGTHLDALSHVADHGMVHGGLSIAAAQDEQAGLIHGSIADVGPIVRRGVFIDAVALRGGDVLRPEDVVDATILDRFESLNNIRVNPGDCVLIRTGWDAHWASPATYIGIETGTPGIDSTAADWLAERGVFLVGADTWGVEHTVPGQSAFPVHLSLLAGHGIHILENLRLDRLAARHEPHEFVFVCTPLMLVGASGSPVRPVAIFPGTNKQETFQ